MRCTRPFLRMMSLALLLGCTGAVAAPVTTGSLIGGMVDMHGLADFPDPSYKTIQFSSYDHRSSHPGGPHWFDNSDGFGGEPVPNFEAVLKEPEKKGKEGDNEPGKWSRSPPFQGKSGLRDHFPGLRAHSAAL